MEDSLDSFLTLNPNVSRETINKLTKYRDLILSASFNLISKNDKNNIWIRHFHDSIRLVDYIEKTKEYKEIIDIGSGAGLPGLVIAIHQPWNTVTMSEKTKRKPTL